MVDVLTSRCRTNLPTASRHCARSSDAERLSLAVSAPASSPSPGPSPTTSSSGTARATSFPTRSARRACRRGRTFLSFAERRRAAHASARCIETQRRRATDQFDIDIEFASAMGSIWFAMLGTRIAGRERHDRAPDRHDARDHRAQRENAAADLSRHARRTDRSSQPQFAARRTDAGHRQGEGRGAQLRLPRRLDRPPRDDQRHLWLRRRRRGDRRGRRAAVAHAALAPTSSAAPPATSSASSCAIAANARLALVAERLRARCATT